MFITSTILRGAFELRHRIKLTLTSPFPTQNERQTSPALAERETGGAAREYSVVLLSGRRWGASRKRTRASTTPGGDRGSYASTASAPAVRSCGRRWWGSGRKRSPLVWTLSSQTRPSPPRASPTSKASSLPPITSGSSSIRFLISPFPIANRFPFLSHHVLKLLKNC